MTFRIEFTDVADMETQEIFLWILADSPDRAERWQDRLERSVMSLSEFPARCALAPETAAFHVEVRQHMFGAYRILFTLIDADDDGEDDTVRILHVRHGARRPLGPRNDEDTP